MNIDTETDTSPSEGSEKMSALFDAMGDLFDGSDPEVILGAMFAMMNSVLNQAQSSELTLRSIYYMQSLTEILTGAADEDTPKGNLH